jgi:hypothetical protein
LGGVPGGGFGDSSGGLGPLGGLFSRRRGRTELLDLDLEKSQPRRERVLLGSSCGGGSLGGGGTVLRGLSGGFKGCLRRRLTHHRCGRHHSSHNELHLQLGPLRAELACCAGQPLT